jgi:flavin-dependent dehydrogenase
MGEGIGPAIRSGQLAAESILSGTQYSVASIPRFSSRPCWGSGRADKQSENRLLLNIESRGILPYTLK